MQTCEECNEEPSSEFLHGLEQFNSHEYFECHETLERIWIAEKRPVRTIYKGILQVGVGCYHLLRGNFRGGTMKLASGMAYLEPFAPYCLGVNIENLISEAGILLAEVSVLGPEKFQGFSHSLLPVVRFIPRKISEKE